MRHFGENTSGIVIPLLRPWPFLKNLATHVSKIIFWSVANCNGRISQLDEVFIEVFY